MTEMPTGGLGPLAAALAGGEPPDLAGVSDAEVAGAAVEVAAAHAADYLRRDGDELDLAMIRTMIAGVPGVDRALVDWLGAAPSGERLGIVSRALWQLWSTANPHPPLEDDVVRAFVAAAGRAPLTWLERGPYAAALRLAAAQVGSPATVALLDQALAASGG